MSTAASSTMDYLCIGSVLMDTRLKLLEDMAEETKVGGTGHFSGYLFLLGPSSACIVISRGVHATHPALHLPPLTSFYFPYSSAQDQMGSVFRNLEVSFDYLRKLQEGVNGKAAADVVSGLDRALRAMARECMALGPSLAQDVVGGSKDGPLTGSKLCE